MLLGCSSQNFTLGSFGTKRSAPACSSSSPPLPRQHPHLLPSEMRRKQMSPSRFVAHFSVSFSFYSVSHYSAPPRFGWQSAHMTIKPGLLIRHVSQNNKSVCRVFNPLLESTAKNSPQLNITQSTYVTAFLSFFFTFLPGVCVLRAVERNIN